MIRYTCQPELLPMVEAALAANGYAIEAPLQKQMNGDTLLVMAHGAAIVLLTHDEQSDQAKVDIAGAAQSAAGALLESLPIALEKQPHPSEADRRFEL
jgi:hypothetical protein